MGKKGGGPAPTPPDPAKTITAQGNANKEAIAESARINAVNITGPGGRVIYRRDSRGIPIEQITQLNPTAQKAFDGQQAVTLDLTNRARNALKNAPQTAFSLDGIRGDPNKVDLGVLGTFNPNSFARPSGAGVGSMSGGGDAAPGGSVWSMKDDGQNLPYDPRSYGNVTEFNNTASRAVLSEFERNNNALFQQQSADLERNLTNRGIAVGSEGWNRAMSDLALQHNNARLGAQNQSVLTGHQVAGDIIGREQGLRSTAFNEALQTHNTNTQDSINRISLEQNLRDRAIAERERVRNSAINDATLYLTGAPALTMPNTPGMATYNQAPVDVAGIQNNAFQNQLAAHNQRQQQKQSIWQGVGNLAQTGASLWMMSSRAYKEDIGDAEVFLRTVEQLPVKTWRYTQDHADLFGEDTDLRIGPMAEDWAKLFGGPTDRININNAVFVLYRAVQELSAKVRRMEVAHA